jgi:hypothetical protein
VLNKRFYVQNRMLRTATPHMQNDLLEGRYYVHPCTVTTATIHLSLELRRYLFPLMVTVTMFLNIVAEQCQILECKKDLLKQSQLHGFCNLFLYVWMPLFFVYLFFFFNTYIYAIIHT